MTEARAFRWLSATPAMLAMLVALVACALALLAAPAAYADGLAAVDADGTDAQAEQAKLARKTVDDGVYALCPASRSGYAVTVKGASGKAGAKVVSATRSDTDWAQMWTAVWDPGTGYYKLRNMNSRMFLGVSGAVKAGASLKQFASAKSNAQLWEPVEVPGGVSFKAAGTDLAIAASGSSGAPALSLAAANAGKAQTFTLKAAKPLAADQTYFVKSLSTGKRVSVAGESRSSGAKAGLAKPKDKKAQKFRVLKSGSALRLQNVKSCYYVGAKAKGSTTAAQLKSKSAAGTWNIELDLESAAFTLESRKAGKRLDAAGGKLAFKEASSDASQLFTFKKTYAFKLYLNPGHGRNSNGNGVVDPGASGSGHTEAELSHDLARRVVKLLADSDVKVVNGEKYKLAYWKRMPKAVKLKCDAIVSIHFDAGGSSGTLGMVGVQGKAAGSDKLCNIIRKSVVKKLGLPDRKNVKRSDITCVNGKIPSMLVEVCYMDNAHDVATYLKKRDAVARGMADGIVKASRTRGIVK